MLKTKLKRDKPTPTRVAITDEVEAKYFTVYNMPPEDVIKTTRDKFSNVTVQTTGSALKPVSVKTQITARTTKISKTMTLYGVSVQDVYEKLVG